MVYILVAITLFEHGAADVLSKITVIRFWRLPSIGVIIYSASGTSHSSTSLIAGMYVAKVPSTNEPCSKAPSHVRRDYLTPLPAGISFQIPYGIEDGSVTDLC